MEQRLKEIIQLSLGSTPEKMLSHALQACIEISGAAGGSILAEEGPFLQILFSDVPSLIGVKVPFDSIAGVTVRNGVIIYTYAPSDKRHFEGVDRQTAHETRYLLSIPIPGILQSSGGADKARNAGALQLLFPSDIVGGSGVESGAKEMRIEDFRGNDAYTARFGEVFRLLPNIAFGIEVVRIRQTSYQAIHELKNKLISAHSWLNCLHEDLEAQAAAALADPQVKDDWELVESSIREGAELAKTYLAFTRIYEPHYDISCINDVLREVGASAAAFGRELGLESLRVETMLDPAIKPRSLDADKLKMAFFNLSKNAVEALAEFAVASPTLRIESRLESGHIVITVADNGPGMPKEIAENLFIPFKTQKEGGTGLGLTITKKIIDIHGGTIECRSGPGGTSFVVKLEAPAA